MDRMMETLKPAKIMTGLANERGTALVLTLVMLTLMSILGAMALSTSNTELGISGNLRSSQKAFYAAERAAEYAMTNGDIFDRSITAFPVNLNQGVYYNALRVDDSGLRSGATNEVDYVTTGALPPGSGSDPMYFQSRYYVITVNGEGPHNATSRIEAQVARIVPK